MMKLFLSLISVAILISCGESTPKGIVPKEKMMKVLWEYMEGNVYAFEQMKDTAQEDTLVNAKMQSNLFKKYQITSDEFENSYRYYAKDSKLFKEMIDSIITRRQRLDTIKMIKEDFVQIVDSLAIKKGGVVPMVDTLGKIKRGNIPEIEL